jgi:cytochrome c5
MTVTVIATATAAAIVMAAEAAAAAAATVAGTAPVFGFFCSSCWARMWLVDGSFIALHRWDLVGVLLHSVV